MFVPLLKLHHLLGQRFVGFRNSAMLIMGEDADAFQSTFCGSDGMGGFCVKDTELSTHSRPQGCADGLGIVGAPIHHGQQAVSYTHLTLPTMAVV